MEQRSAQRNIGPLEGVKVLDISTILAGPLCAQILGDFGATVVKVELPGRGDGLRGHGLSKGDIPLWWKMVGRNKSCLALDLRTPDGADLFRRLAATADVIVENFRPGTLERWGLGYDVLSQDNPGLVLVRVTGFGQTGPYASRPAFGTLVEAMSGFAHLTGAADGPPTLPAFGLADSIAGIAGAAAVSMALLDISRGGTGQVIDLDLLTPIMTAVGPAVLYADQLGLDLHRSGNGSLNNAPRNTYLTRDGHWLAISTSADSIAARVLNLVGYPELALEAWFATGRGRAEHAGLLDGHVGAWIAERTRDEVMTAFTEAGAAVAPVYRPSELLADPQVQALQLITTVEDADLGPMRMQNVLWRMSKTPGSIRSTGRGLGQDTAEVLQDELGLTPDQVEGLRQRGIIS